MSAKITLLRTLHWAASFLGRNRITDRLSGWYYDACVERFMQRKRLAEYAAETARVAIAECRGEKPWECLAGDPEVKSAPEPADWDLHDPDETWRSSKGGCA